MIRRQLLALGAIAAAAAPAGAVGLGPLVNQGIIDGPKKAFYLTLLNPYPQAMEFIAYPAGLTDEDPAPLARVMIYPSDVTLGSARSRKLLVIASDLAVGESFTFRVCAERKTPPQGIQIHARVCSKLTARRVA